MKGAPGNDDSDSREWEEGLGTSFVLANSVHTPLYAGHLILILFAFSSTSCDTQGSLLAICSEITPGLGNHMGRQGSKKICPGSATFKVDALLLWYRSSPDFDFFP